MILISVLIWVSILFTISLRSALLYVILPYPTYVIVLLILFILAGSIFILLLLPQSIRVLRLYDSVTFVAIFGSYFLFAFFAMVNSMFAGGGYREFARMIGIPSLFIILLSLIWGHESLKYGSKQALKYILRPYVYLSLYISTTGILVWFLLTFGLIDADNWLFNLTEATKGLRPRPTLYTFPFKLNLAESHGFKFLSYPLFRMCGFFEESHQAGIFITPSLFITQFFYADSPKMRRTSSFLISFFLVLTFSPTVLSILYFCAALYAIKQLSKRDIVLLVTIVPLVIGFLIFKKVVYMLQLYTPEYMETRMSSYENLLYVLSNISKYTGSFFGSGVLEPSGQLTFNIAFSFGLGGIILIYFHYIIVFALCLFLFFSKRKFAIMGLSPITVILHLHKGAHLDDPFYFYILSVTVIFLALPVLQRYKRR